MGKFSKAAYNRKIEAIFVRFPSVQKVPFGDAYKPGLEHMIEFSGLLGDPHKEYRTIHIAGTNGKGSVANMLASALAAAGLKVGLYTSPHIEDFRERARILSPPVLIPEEYVYDFLCRYDEDMDTLDLSFFEITTGLAFKWFADEKVDVAVIETGLGGRLDSTNIIIPDLSIITSIALDHCALLGDTLEAIAAEKAGIFKPGVPALVGEYLPETRPVFESRARETGSTLVCAEETGPSLGGRTEGILNEMDLRGRYQAKNLRTVLAAVDILKECPFYSGLDDTEAVVDALEHTAERAGFHGRWERISDHPTVIADIGHNPAALKGNFAQLEEMMATGEYSSLIIVYAIMADKDLAGIMPLMPSGATYIFTNPKTRRAMPVEELTARYKAFCEEEGRPDDKVFHTPSVHMALRKAFGLDKGGNPLIYVGGSTYLVSEAVREMGGSKSLQGF